MSEILYESEHFSIPLLNLVNQSYARRESLRLRFAFPAVLRDFAGPKAKFQTELFVRDKWSSTGYDLFANGMVEMDARHWIAYLLGTQKPDAYLGQIEALKHKDPEVYFAVTVLWKILTSWVAHLEEY